MIYQLDLRKCIYKLVRQRKKYEIYQLFKDKNISKSIIYQTINGCENGSPCVVKPIIAKPRIAENKKLRNVLQSIKNRVGASSQLVVRKNNITHSTILRVLKKNDVISSLQTFL
jgi:hypothetical protein